jgi:alcohol dehydrogenase class IV
VCLPAVCKFNAAKGANVERQKKVSTALMKIPEVVELMETAGMDNSSDIQLGDILDRVIGQGLGMPRTLTDVGVRRDQLDALAENVLTDHWAATNPVPLVEKAMVLEVLDMMF